jgi:hypothetical protein
VNALDGLLHPVLGRLSGRRGFLSGLPGLRGLAFGLLFLLFAFCCGFFSCLLFLSFISFAFFVLKLKKRS